MKAVILAAGKGTRMGPLTENRPKVMLPIVNRPLLEHIILTLKIAGIREFFIVVGYCKEKIIEYFGNGSGLGIRIEYIEQKSLKGTADAIAVAKDFVNGRFFVANGDVMAGLSDIKKMIYANGDVVLAAKKVANPGQYGVIYVKGNKILKIVEKP
ncbi:MAG: NTP transferase domain-containing protein [Candidatus Methanoperedens sp.]|nr:NTP transferase domain-containing protein [Candidatus Methanoperedens sp.]